MLAQPGTGTGRPLVTVLMCGIGSASGHWLFALLSPCSSSSARAAGVQRPDPSVTPAAAAVNPTNRRRETMLGESLGPARENLGIEMRLMISSFFTELCDMVISE